MQYETYTCDELLRLVPTDHSPIIVDGGNLEDSMSTCREFFDKLKLIIRIKPNLPFNSSVNRAIPLYEGVDPQVLLGLRPKTLGRYAITKKYKYTMDSLKTEQYVFMPCDNQNNCKLTLPVLAYSTAISVENSPYFSISLMKLFIKHFDLLITPVPEEPNCEEQFVALYKNTGKPLYQVVDSLRNKGYTRDDIYDCIMFVLKDAKWEE